jgi:hypothetical protein
LTTIRKDYFRNISRLFEYDMIWWSKNSNEKKDGMDDMGGVRERM